MNNTSRRTVLAGAGAAGLTAALAGCTAYGDTGTDGASPPGAAPAGTGGATAVQGGDDGGGDDGAAPAPAGGGGFAKTSDIPVGGGKIFEDQKIVVTQPTAGNFKCF